MIRLDHVTKHYGGPQKALSDVTVEIKNGEFVFLIGPSGSGKTTLLRLLIRDIVPTEGKVFVDDWEINQLRPSRVYHLRRKVGTVFQDFKLLADRTVYENIALGLEILGKKEKDIAKDVKDVLNLVGLEGKERLFPLQLSAGELQRIGIARAIVGGPSILLADEPTGNLDPETAWDILSILQEINAMGTTVVMSTHNAAIVDDLRKRTITLHHGKVVSDEEKGKYHFAKKSTHSEKK